MTKKDNVVEPNWEEQSPERPYYLDIDGKRLWVTEEIYRAYKQPLWNEKKRIDSETRCVIASDRTGIKKCREKCSECPHFRNGKVLSLDQLYEDFEFEVAVQSPSIIDSLIEDEMKAELWKAVDSLGEVNSQIIRLFAEGLSERQIGKKLGLNDTIVHRRKVKSFSILRKLLENFKNM